MNADASITGTSTSTCDELMTTLEELVYQHTNLNDATALDWVSTGVNCKVLQVGGGWQKGKIRLRIEFIADKPNSPLDDLRNNL